MSNKNNSVILHLITSVSGKKELFCPINESCIKMYVCGPTVYDRPHLGNARSIVIYDLLYRILKFIYPSVIYVRNITDVDDKIINIAKSNNEEISFLTKRITEEFHADIKALNCLEPTFEPKATDHINDMIEIMQKLLEQGFAYISEGHVIFNVNKFAEYGALSKRKREEMIDGARIEVAEYKKDPADFILWKPASLDEAWCSFDSPWGLGRPGWHIECSAMSMKYLGHSFDIHGGGLDLIFPHHENEIAQSKCANQNALFAKYWIHNGFLTVDGEKMSKSLGNFKTVKEILDKGVDGATLRYFYFSSHYRKPQDFNEKAIYDAKKSVEKFYLATRDVNIEKGQFQKEHIAPIMQFLCDDINTPALLAHLHSLLHKAIAGNAQSKIELAAACDFLGLDFSNMAKKSSENDVIDPIVIQLADERIKAKKNKDWNLADQLRNQIVDMGYNITDTKDGYDVIKK